MSSLVSIVVPIYNVEKYLEECYVSIVNQTYENIEIILVNDGATDNSGDIADKLAKTDVRVSVIHKKNGGLSDARNVGMGSAKGEYITFVDSDDTIDKNFVKELIEVAKKTSAAIVQGDNSRSSDGLGAGSGEVVSLSGNDAFNELMKFKVVSPTAWGKLYDISLFRENGIEFPVGRIHEDTAVLYKLIYHARTVSMVSRVLYFYRLNDNSIMTASYTKKHFDSVTKYHEELEEFILENGILINKKVVYRHKALRLLSVLNKLAVSEKKNIPAYANFAQEYRMFATRSGSLVCMLGLIPVMYPGFFVGVRRVTPLIRRALGKV